MEIKLNETQTNKLAEVSLDLSKGLLLGAVGYAFVRPASLSLISSIIILICALYFIKFGLDLLN